MRKSSPRITWLSRLQGHRFCLLLVLAGMLGLPTFTQAQPPNDQLIVRYTEQQTQDSNLVSIEVQVLDRQGQSPSLDASHVQANLGDLPIAPLVEAIAPNASPLYLMLVVDTTDTIDARIFQQVSNFVLNLKLQNPEANLGLITFSDETALRYAPQANNMDAISNALLGLNTERIGQNENVVVSAVNMALSNLESLSGQNKAVVLVTDATAINFQNEANTNLNAISNYNIPIYTITIPPLVGGDSRNTNGVVLADRFAESSAGFAYTYDFERYPRPSLEAASTHLAASFENIIRALRNRYLLRFDLNKINPGDLPSGLYNLVIKLNINGQEASFSTNVNYTLNSYAASFKGLQASQQISGSVPLDLMFDPPLATGRNYSYDFYVNDQPICLAVNVPSCPWDTNSFQSLGYVNLVAFARDGNVIVSQTALRLNAYRQDLAVTPPEQFLGEVSFEVLPASYSNFGDKLSLYVQPLTASTYQEVGTALLANEPQASLVWDISSTDLGQGANTSINANLRLDLISSIDNALIARWEQNNITLYYPPDYAFNWDKTPFALQNNRPPTLQGSYPVNIEVPLLAGTQDYLALYLVALDGSYQVLAEGQAGSPNLTHNFDTQGFAAGLYEIGPVILRKVGERPIILKRDLQVANLAASLPGVSFSQLSLSGTIEGSSLVNVNTSGYQGDLVILRVDGVEVSRTERNNQGVAQLFWDIDQLYFSAGATAPQAKSVQIDITDINGIVYARYQQTLMVAPKVLLRLVDPNLPAEITTPFPLILSLNPPPQNPTEYIYFARLDVGGSSFQLDKNPNNPNAFTIDPAKLNPGAYQLVIEVNKNSEQVIAEQRNIRLVQSLSLVGDFEQTTLKNKPRLEANHIPTISNVVVRFKPNGQNDFLTVVDISRATNRSNVDTRTEIDIPLKDFFRNQGFEGPQEGELMVELRDTQGQVLYRWLGNRSLVYEPQISLVVSLPVLLALSLLNVFLLWLVRRDLGLFWEARNNHLIGKDLQKVQGTVVLQRGMQADAFWLFTRDYPLKGQVEKRKIYLKSKPRTILGRETEANGCFSLRKGNDIPLPLLPGRYARQIAYITKRQQELYFMPYKKQEDYIFIRNKTTNKWVLLKDWKAGNPEEYTRHGLILKSGICIGIGKINNEEMQVELVYGPELEEESNNDHSLMSSIQEEKKRTR
jgi:hypothetical protein